MMVVGLGNPGPEYECSRHNVGFLVVDELARRGKAGPFQVRFDSFYLRARIHGEEVLLVKPQSFMNASGRPVRAWLDALQLLPSRLIVVHDDLDLPLGRLKVTRGGGHGGHRGVRSLQEALGTSDFPRVKVGIGRPPAGLDPVAYVLAPFDPAEAEEAAAAIGSAADAVEMVVVRSLEAAQNRFNVRSKEWVSREVKA